MDKLKLKAQKRELTGKKVAKLRREGFIPTVAYGKSKESIALLVNKKEFDHVYKIAGGNTIVMLDIEGSTKNVLINQVDRDVVKGSIIHADFYQVSMTEKITASVPLVFIGDSNAVITLGGSLLTPKTEVEVECLPGDLPHEISVDLGKLDDFESSIHISDLLPPQGVEIKDDPEETVALVEPPRSDEELSELEEPVGEVEMPESETGAEESTEEQEQQ